MGGADGGWCRNRSSDSHQISMGIAGCDSPGYPPYIKWGMQEGGGPGIADCDSHTKLVGIAAAIPALPPTHTPRQPYAALPLLVLGIADCDSHTELVGIVAANPATPPPSYPPSSTGFAASDSHTNLVGIAPAISATLPQIFAANCQGQLHSIALNGSLPDWSKCSLITDASHEELRSQACAGW